MSKHQDFADRIKNAPDLESKLAHVRAYMEAIKPMVVLSKRNQAIKLRKIGMTEEARREQCSSNEDEPLAYAVLRKAKIDTELVNCFESVGRAIKFTPPRVPMTPDLEAEMLEKAKEIYRIRRLLQEKLSHSARNAIESRLKKLEFALRFVVRLGHFNFKDFTWPSGWHIEFGDSGSSKIMPPQD